MPPLPSHSTFAGRSNAVAGSSRVIREGRVVDRHELQYVTIYSETCAVLFANTLSALPSLDSNRYYDIPSSPSSSADSNISDPPSPLNITTNLNNKLMYSSRWMRKGKAYPWAPSFEDAKAEKRIRKRLRLCLEQVLPEAAAELGVAPPPNIADAEERRAKRKRRRQEEREFLLPHLASPSPPRSTSKLAPLLVLPQTYVDILTSPAMRHSLGDDTMEMGLQRTANELLEGEKGLMQALGRLREVLRLRERDVTSQTDGKDSPNAPNDVPSAAYQGEPVPSLPKISETDNLWRVTQELLQAQPQPTIEYSITPAGAAQPSSVPDPVVTPIHKLFTSESGMTVSAVPSPGHPGLSFPPNHPSYPATIKYNLDMPSQTKAVDDALERIGELLADCNEYKERLEEARDRVADVARARKKVWSVIKERASREMDAKGL